MSEFYKNLMRGLGVGFSILIIFILLLLIMEFVFSSSLFDDLTTYLYRLALK